MPFKEHGAITRKRCFHGHKVEEDAVMSPVGASPQSIDPSTHEWEVCVALMDKGL